MVYAVIDTNVFVSALLSKHDDAATVRLLYHTDILSEYDEVLHRRKFHLRKETVQTVLAAIRQYGIEVCPQDTGETLPDMDDLIFYEVAMAERGRSYLVTGNQKHYPQREFIVTPAELLNILEKRS